MANFGFRQLAVAAPYEEHWREAKSAVGAPELLRDARQTASLEEAAADCTLVVGTGLLSRRKPEQPAVSLPELPPLVRREIERGGRVALVFGSEKRGLTREDLSYCQLLVEIPTDPRQPSMNLGQAVAVCLYELASCHNGPGFDEPREESPTPDADPLAPADLSQQAQALTRLKPRDLSPPASGRDLERLAAVVEETMLAANYSPPPMRQANRLDLRLLLRKLALTQRDTRRILGLFRRILWRLKHRSSGTKKSRRP